jgi:hypothetical protein
MARTVLLAGIEQKEELDWAPIVMSVRLCVNERAITFLFSSLPLT